MANIKNKNNSQEKIEQLLAMAWNASNPELELKFANQILEINPDNVEALIIKADNTENQEEALGILNHALEALDKPGNCNEEEKKLLFISINHRMAYAYMSLGDFDNAFGYCENTLKFCDENSDDEYIRSEYDDTMMKALFYRILIERHDWQRILSESMRDSRNTLGRAYAKLIAAWFSGGNKNICASLLWDALSIAPDVPFYILGYFEEPDEDSEPEAFEDFSFALMYYDTVSITDEFFNWFSRGVILFGLLSGRFEAKEHDYMIDVIDNLGGYDEYEKMKSIIVETEDSLVLEALAAHKCMTN